MVFVTNLVVVLVQVNVLIDVGLQAMTARLNDGVLDRWIDCGTKAGSMILLKRVCILRMIRVDSWACLLHTASSIVLT